MTTFEQAWQTAASLQTGNAMSPDARKQAWAEFGAYLRQLRASRSVTQRGVAAYLDSSADTSQFSRVENGQRRASDALLRAYALCLDIEFGHLVSQRESIAQATAPPAAMLTPHGQYVLERVDLCFVIRERRPIHCLQHRTIRSTAAGLQRIPIATRKIATWEGGEVGTWNEPLYGCTLDFSDRYSDELVRTVEAVFTDPLDASETREIGLIQRISDKNAALKPIFAYSTPVPASWVVLRMQFFGDTPRELRFYSNLTELESHSVHAGHQLDTTQGIHVSLNADGYCEQRLRNVAQGTASFFAWDW